MRTRPGHRSFTLVEMLTVVVIIILILGFALPGFTSVWEERKVAQVVTTLHGVLASTRAKAMRGAERGLFFYVDQNTQRQMIVPIVSDPPSQDLSGHEYVLDCGLDPTAEEPDPITDCISYPMTEHRFRTIEGDIHELPAPIRVAPRELLLLDENGDPRWEAPDIAHDRYSEPAVVVQWPRHRNFFTVIFGPDGRLIAGRDVIIHDTALRNPDTGALFASPTGYRTKLPVGDPTKYYTNLDPNDPSDTEKFDPKDERPLYDIIVEMDQTSIPPQPGHAINVRSADALLVYDDNVLAETPHINADDTFKRQYLLKNARPIYISRLTGEVFEGPRGENE